MFSTSGLLWLYGLSSGLMDVYSRGCLSAATTVVSSFSCGRYVFSSCVHGLESGWISSTGLGLFWLVFAVWSDVSLGLSMVM